MQNNYFRTGGQPKTKLVIMILRIRYIISYLQGYFEKYGKLFRILIRLLLQRQISTLLETRRWEILESDWLISYQKWCDYPVFQISALFNPFSHQIDAWNQFRYQDSWIDANISVFGGIGQWDEEKFSKKDKITQYLTPYTSKLWK